jgi:hypothetical protein
MEPVEKPGLRSAEMKEEIFYAAHFCIYLERRKLELHPDFEIEGDYDDARLLEEIGKAVTEAIAAGMTAQDEHINSGPDFQVPATLQ